MRDSGTLRHRIIFQSFNGETDSYGDILDEDDANWTDSRKRWASVQPISGKEFYAAEQSQSEVTHKIRCRYFPGATPKMRILFNNRKFKIISILDFNEHHEELLIMAKELIP